MLSQTTEQECGDLLLRLTQSHESLLSVNKELNNRPFSTRLHGQFCHQMKKSKHMIDRMTTLLKKFYSDFYSASSSSTTTTTTEVMQETLLIMPTIINESFITVFKDLCLRIEHEWRVGIRFLAENEKISQKKKNKNFQLRKSKRLIMSNNNNNNNKSRHRSHSLSRSRSYSPSIMKSGAGSDSPLHQSLMILKSHSNQSSPVLKPLTIIKKKKFSQISATADADANANANAAIADVPGVDEHHSRFRFQSNPQSQSQQQSMSDTEILIVHNNKNRNKKNNAYVCSSSQIKPGSADDNYGWSSSSSKNKLQLQQPLRLSEEEEKKQEQQPQQMLYVSQSEYNQRIGSDFVPYEQSRAANVSRSIIAINDDLQYLLSMQSQIASMVEKSQESVNVVEENTAQAQSYIAEGASVLSSIRRSRWTYAILGGVGAMAVAGPALVIGIGVGIKTAMGGAAGIGIIGSYAGSKIAQKANQVSDEQTQQMKEDRIKYQKNENNDNINEYRILAKDEDIEPWDARN